MFHLVHQVQVEQMLSTSSSSLSSANDGISRCLFYDSCKTENRIRNDLIFCSFLRIFIEF